MTQVAMAVAGIVLLGATVYWGFTQYLGRDAATFLATAPFPCPFHLGR